MDFPAASSRHFVLRTDRSPGRIEVLGKDLWFMLTAISTASVKKAWSAWWKPLLRDIEKKGASAFHRNLYPPGVTLSWPAVVFISAIRIRSILLIFGKGSNLDRTIFICLKV